MLKKLLVLISTCPQFPVLNNIQKASFVNLIRQLSTSADEAKNDLIVALNEISDTLSSLTVAGEKEPVLERFIIEYDASIFCAH